MQDVLMIVGPAAAVLVVASVLYIAQRAERCASELQKIRELLEADRPH